MKITVDQLIRDLQIHDGDAIVDFSGLDFHRVKGRGFDQQGNEIVQIEFEQVVFKNNEGNVVIQNLRDNEQ